MLQRDNTVLVLIDVQEKLMAVIDDRDALAENTRRLVAGMNVLDVPTIFTEQNPAGLGPTIKPVAELLTGEPILKMAFSCCGEPSFLEAIESTGKKQILIAGIEAHVCVCQTTLDLLERGHDVFVVADAVGSRAPSNKAVALDRMKTAGATLVSVEMALFELLARADSLTFKDILRIVK